MDTEDRAELAATLRTAVVRTSRRLRHDATGEEVTLPQYAVLAALKNGPLTPRQLAQREQVRPPWMTRTVAALAEAGLVTRAGDPNDGRQVLVSLTDAGRAAIAVTRRRRTEWLADRLAGLDAEECRALARAAEILLRVSAS
jgi:DNA-binding MarR family transcriptional regulator